MLVMSDEKIGPKFEVRRSIRTTTVAETAMESVVHKVKTSKRVGWRKPGKVSQEAVYNAIWLWLDDLPQEVIVDAMTKYVPMLKAKMLARPPGRVSPGGVPEGAERVVPGDLPPGVERVTPGSGPPGSERLHGEVMDGDPFNDPADRGERTLPPARGGSSAPKTGSIPIEGEGPV